MGGVAFIPALIVGLFAVSEAITQFERLVEPKKEKVNPEETAAFASLTCARYLRLSLKVLL